jgi:acetylornithine deacetylase/succinyl-diaminopimelate desuccinylase-like protein
MPGVEELAHQADERVAVSELARNSMIYAAAIARLACVMD